MKQFISGIVGAFLATGGTLSELNEPRHDHDRTILPRDPVDANTRQWIEEYIGKCTFIPHILQKVLAQFSPLFCWQ